MKIKFLGTAAAEGTPAFFCDCEVCRLSRERGGKNIRTRTQALIDGKLLIDFGPDTYYHLIRDKINLTDVENCLITHVHEDHLYERELYYLGSGFGHPHNGYVFNIYGSEDIKAITEPIAALTEGRLNINAVKPFKPFTVGDYTVTALKAWHGTENPYIYLITKDNKTILYAHDSDMFPKETQEYLESVKPHIDLASLDCTNANAPEITYRGHMGLIQNKQCRQYLTETGIADTNTVFVLNHFSHNGTNCLYDEFLPIAEKYGFIVSYDSMEIEI